jgi:hypothetical protein
MIKRHNNVYSICKEAFYYKVKTIRETGRPEDSSVGTVTVDIAVGCNMI